MNLKKQAISFSNEMYTERGTYVNELSWRLTRNHSSDVFESVPAVFESIAAAAPLVACVGRHAGVNQLQILLISYGEPLRGNQWKIIAKSESAKCGVK